MNNRHPASFRDPSGFVYEQNGIIYRFVDVEYKKHLEQLYSSGLYENLIKKLWILPVEQVPENHFAAPNWLATLQPQRIPFLNYAWEWSFDQLKDAALVTLDICKAALAKNMILKDATHFNIQFADGLPKHIDTLSFELYEEGTSWIAYRQFCECFLNPLLLAAYCNMETHKLLLAYPDGVSVGLTSKWLPFATKLNTHILLHVHVHAKYGKAGSQQSKAPEKKISKAAVLNILNSLTACISKLQLKEQSSTWNNYYNETILSDDYLQQKKTTVKSWMNELAYHSVCDYGANEGEFSKLCRSEALVVANDFDSNCINRLYQSCKNQKVRNILPLVVDLTQPSPAMGWENKEQPAFINRKQFDLSLALALIHHLVIGKNLSFEQTATFFAQRSNWLIIEFVPKDDPKVRQMLGTKKDIYATYDQASFEQAFAAEFTIVKQQPLQHSQRILYLMKKR
ncbi:MAG: hypothetical protein KGZ74_06230 [Chitinophagaceae bacterium]|nr:hypothetical protein [Chitinophagaceae bacterium]